MTFPKSEMVHTIIVTYIIFQDLENETKDVNNYIREFIITNTGTRNRLKEEEIKIIKSSHIVIEKGKLEDLSTIHKSQKWNTLTIRQKNIANLLALGKRDNEISQILNFSSSTIRKENMLIARKLGVNLRKNS